MPPEEFPQTQFYRLPTDEEWSWAVGIGGRESGATPKEKNAKLKMFIRGAGSFRRRRTRAISPTKRR